MSDPVQSPVFVGRREEIASLTALLERAASGEPGFAIVAGEAGVGKTRLVTSLRGVRVVLLATYRSDELNRRHPLRPLIASWDRLRTVQHVELRRFEPGEVAAQLGAILGTEPAAGLVDMVFDRSGGNAYLVEELAGVMRGGGDPADLPPSLADVLLSRADALSAGAQRLLRTAAVAGRSVPDKLLAEVAGVGDAGVYAGLR